MRAVSPDDAARLLAAHLTVAESRHPSPNRDGHSSEGSNSQYRRRDISASDGDEPNDDGAEDSELDEVDDDASAVRQRAWEQSQGCDNDGTDPAETGDGHGSDESSGSRESERAPTHTSDVRGGTAKKRKTERTF